MWLSPAGRRGRPLCRRTGGYAAAMQTRPKSPNPRAARACDRVVAVLTTLAVAAVLSACGSKSSTSSTPAKVNVDTAKVARSIEQSILAQRHLASTVVCPVTVPAERGKTFECVATTHAAKKPHTPLKTTFLVTVQNNRGGVTYVGK
jgi:anti-sigma factor RsiW